MKKKINNIKTLYLDVDNTALCLKMYSNDGINDKENGKRIIGIKDDVEWLKYNIYNNAYIHCEAPQPLVRLVNIIKNNGGKIYGLTECKNSFEYNAKFNRLKECYDGNFLHHGDLIAVSTRHDKVPVMKMLAERDGLQLNEVMFIDDSYSEVMEAAEEGILSMHTVEAVLRFNNEDDDDFETKGIKG